MQGDDYPDRCPTEHAWEQLEQEGFEAMLAEAEERWEAEQKSTQQRITEALKTATGRGMDVRLWKAAEGMLADMIDATENGDAIREDFGGDQTVQQILLDAFEPVRLAFDTIHGVLREVNN